MTRADLRAQMRCTCFNYNERKRVKGIEPSCAAWEAAVLPLNYTRDTIFDSRFSIADCNPNKVLNVKSPPAPNGCSVHCLSAGRIGRQYLSAEDSGLYSTTKPGMR